MPSSILSSDNRHSRHHQPSQAAHPGPRQSSSRYPSVIVTVHHRYIYAPALARALCPINAPRSLSLIYTLADESVPVSCPLGHAVRRTRRDARLQRFVYLGMRSAAIPKGG